jgi:L-alanine-DL-glutamate epimerase-like enolase superfamily enzyme
MDRTCKIERIELFHVDIPLAAPFWPAWIPGYPQKHSRFTLLRLTTNDGIVGWSAGNAFANERAGLGDLIGPYLLGLDPTDIPRVRQLLREASFLGWHNPWVEAACWDIKGKREGKPVYQLLNPDLPAPVTEASVYASTGSLKPLAERREYLDTIRAMGFTGVKLRVHDYDMGQDIKVVEAARRHVGPDFTVAVDANQGWRVTLIDDAPLWDLPRATEFARACEDFAVAWLEEPLDMHAYQELAELRRRTSTKIAGCELNNGWPEAKVFLEHGSYDIYQPDAVFAGGLTGAKQIYEACLEQDLAFTPHTWTNGVGFIINLHVFAAYPRRWLLEYPFEPPGWVPSLRDGILEHPIVVGGNGTVEIPQEAGLGLHIDAGALRRYGRRFYRLTPFRQAVHVVRQQGLKTALELKRRQAARLERDGNG